MSLILEAHVPVDSHHRGSHKGTSWASHDPRPVCMPAEKDRMGASGGGQAGLDLRFLRVHLSPPLSTPPPRVIVLKRGAPSRPLLSLFRPEPLRVCVPCHSLPPAPALGQAPSPAVALSLRPCPWLQTPLHARDTHLPLACDRKLLLFSHIFCVSAASLSHNSTSAAFTLRLKEEPSISSWK